MNSKFSHVNVVEQSGLELPLPDSFEIRNGYLGKNHNSTSTVGRFSQPLSWNDTHIMICSDIKPIASPATQHFLQTTTEKSENSNLIYNKHPFIHITYPQRLIKERSTNNTKNFSYSGEKEQYYFNKKYLNDGSIAYNHPNPKHKFNSRFYIQNSDSFSLSFDKNEKKKSSKAIPQPNLHLNKTSPRNKNKNRLKKKRKETVTKWEEFSAFNLHRHISLHSIIHRESTHNCLFFAQSSNLPLSKNMTKDSFSICYDDFEIYDDSFINSPISASPNNS